jgi:F-type H+/Na+-transporting ATPase subunit beta
MNRGRITQIIGSIFEAEFVTQIPAVYNALEIKGEYEGRQVDVIGEVQQHLGGGRVRAIALGSTQGLRRGHGGGRHRQSAEGAGRQRDAGRVFNLLGKPVDGGPEVAGRRKTAHSSQAAEIYRTDGQVGDV